MESTLRNSSSHRSGVDGDPGDSSRWWPVTHSVPRSGGSSGPGRSSAWARPVRISSENSILPAGALGPSGTGSGSVRRGECGLREGQELAGQLATPAGQLLRRPLKGRDHTAPQAFSPTANIREDPGQSLLRKPQFHHLGNGEKILPEALAWVSRGTQYLGLFIFWVLALAALKRKITISSSVPWWMGWKV